MTWFPQSRETKENLIYQNYTQNKKDFARKRKEQGNTNKTKRQPMQWEKIFANDTCNKLISKIYKVFMQLNTHAYTHTHTHTHTHSIPLKKGQRN